MIPIKAGIQVSKAGDIHLYLPESAINDSDQKEFVANQTFERSIIGKSDGSIIFDDILRKSDFIRTYLDCLHLLKLKTRDRVLELGGDRAWASVIIKTRHPECYVVGSDLVPDCIRHASRYERVLQATLDEKWAFSVRDIPFAAEQFDCVFTFAAFHHFGDHCDYSKSLKEIARVLKPGGRIALLYEPSSPKFLHALAHRRVNRIREHEGVDEDVVVPDRIMRVGHELGLTLEKIPFPYARYRPSFVSSAYYFTLSKVKGLHRLMPCTYNYVFTKQGNAR